MSEQESIISLDSLCFRWPSDERNVIDIPFMAVKSGERLFIKGESGSGKTTLLSIIGGIHQANEGNVHVLGKNLSGMKDSQRDHFRSDHIGFIFQLFNLIPYLSVLDNIVLPCKFSKLRKSRALERSSSLQEEALRLLSHLQLDAPDMIQKPVNELSVGQQQRVAAARALIGSPELVIADEPTSALDADVRERFITLLLDECQLSGATLVFVSHDQQLEGLFDRSIHLSELNKASALNHREGVKVVPR